MAVILVRRTYTLVMRDREIKSLCGKYLRYNVKWEKKDGSNCTYVAIAII